MALEKSGNFFLKLCGHPAHASLTVYIVCIIEDSVLFV